MFLSTYLSKSVRGASEKKGLMLCLHGAKRSLGVVGIALVACHTTGMLLPLLQYLLRLKNIVTLSAQFTEWPADLQSW